MTHTENNELTTGPGAPYAAGELVDVTIRGARIMHTYLTSTVISLDVNDDGYEIIHRPGVTFARVAPAEWPPQPADVWRDRNGNAWMAFGDYANTVEMRIAHDGRSSWSDPAEVLAEVGPMRLEYRPGWTRQPDPDPAGPAEPGEIAERTGVVLSLRSLANYIEANPDIPTPYAPSAQCNADSMEHFRELVDRHSATIHVDDDEKAWARLEFGKAGLTIYHRKPKPAAPVVDEPTTTLPIVPILRTPAEWLRRTPGVAIYDADGWRGANGRSWHDPISEDEFNRRLAVSTISTGEDEDGRCPGTAPDTSKIDGLHYCEFYGEHPQVQHQCICGHAWPAADQPVPAPRDAAE